MLSYSSDFTFVRRAALQRLKDDAVRVTAQTAVIRDMSLRMQQLKAWANESVGYWCRRHETVAGELTSARSKIRRLKLDVFRKDNAIREYKADNIELTEHVFDLINNTYGLMHTVATQEVELQQLREGRQTLEAQAQAAIDAYEAECNRLLGRVRSLEQQLLDMDVAFERSERENMELQRKNQQLISGYDAINQGLLGVTEQITQVIEQGGDFS